MVFALKSLDRPNWKDLVHLQAWISVIDQIQSPVPVGAGKGFIFAEGKVVEWSPVLRLDSNDHLILIAGVFYCNYLRGNESHY
jgi:hypothetical protein